MSTGAYLPISGLSARDDSLHPALESPALRQTLVAFGVTAVIGVVIYFAITQRNATLLDQQQRQLQTLAAYLASNQHLTKEQIEALRASGVKGIDTLLDNFSRMQASWESSQRELAAFRQQASERESLQTVSRAQATRAKGRAVQVRDRLTDLASEMASWKAASAALLTDDTGRRVASSKAHLELVLPVFRRERPVDSDMEIWRAELEVLLSPLEAALQQKNSAAVVTPEHSARIEDLGRLAWEALDLLRHDRLILDIAIKETASLQPAETTLNEALRAAELAEAKRQAQQLEDARQATLALQSAELQRVENERIAAQNRLEQEQIARRANPNEYFAKLGAKAAEYQKRTALEKDFAAALPEIRRLLSGFLTPGLQHRGRQADQGPASYAVIKNRALTRSYEGRQYLCSLLEHNDRPAGPLPRHGGYLTDSQHVTCDPAQQLLIRFGPLMVEKGMLAE